MVVVMTGSAPKEAVERVERTLSDWGFQLHVIEGVEKRVIAAVGDKRRVDFGFLESLPGIERVVPILSPYKLVAAEAHTGRTQIKVGPVVIGEDNFVVMAGPCAVENDEQLMTAAQGVAKAGASMLRGGAFKPRTSPYAFQGLEDEGLAMLSKARAKTGLPIVTEAVDLTQVDRVAESSDIIQIGARNMQNFGLLRAVGRTNRPVLLKRGLSATVQEWLMSAEYIMAEGNPNVILCERGIRTFETATRNTLDLSAVALAKTMTHLPILVDPSHGTGKRSLVAPMSKAAIMAGADGLMIEVHPDPGSALSDGDQSLSIPEFEVLMNEIKPIIKFVGKKLVSVS
ncbi:MAG TPA: 3-deoxy-7-phosphoheptulonate synthase [Bacillota bacterium]|nr:3-deoxy-7-phosphoheptulonate synthase [Bacillota bacterium]